MRRAAVVVAIAYAFTGLACTKDAPGFCCLTLENCDEFGVDHVRECEGEQVCVENQCVPTPDAAISDAQPDAIVQGPDGADPCIAAGGRIVFATDRDGDFEVATMLADGTGFQQLTSNTWPDTNPAVSRGLDLIGYSSAPTGPSELWVVGADATNPHVAAASASGGLWSPTVDRLLFVRDEGSLLYEVYGVDWDGNNLADLTQDNTAADWEPTWAPAGNRIAFSTNRAGGTYKIYAMDSDGANQVQLRPGGRKPKWSPSGAYVAFINAGLVRTTSSGVGETPLYSGVVQSFDWSMDSSHIVVCAGNTPATCDIHSVRVSDGNDTPISAVTSDSEPRWSPDGSRVVFTSTRDGNQEIYVANADGTSPENLTMDPGADKNPLWIPCSQ